MLESISQRRKFAPKLLGVQGKKIFWCSPIKTKSRQRLSGSSGKGGISSMKGFGFSIAKLNI
jgi:hypothetical protein